MFECRRPSRRSLGELFRRRTAIYASPIPLCQMAVPLQGEENLIRLPHGCYFISIHNELPSPYRFKMLFAGGSISGPSSFIPSENPPRPQVRPDIWFASITFQRRLQELPWGVENALDLSQKHLLLEPELQRKLICYLY